MRRLLTLAIATSLLAVAAVAAPAAATPTPSKPDKTTITLVTHDSFNVSKSVMRQFCITKSMHSHGLGP